MRRALEIFSSVPRLGVIWSLLMRERYERETRERDCSALRHSADLPLCRIRCPMFSTVLRFGHFSNSGRTSPGLLLLRTGAESRIPPSVAVGAGNDGNCPRGCDIALVRKPYIE